MQNLDAAPEFLLFSALEFEHSDSFNKRACLN